MHPSSTNGSYAGSDNDDQELIAAPAVDAPVAFETGRDHYAEAELRLRSERTEEMIRRAEGYAR